MPFRLVKSQTAYCHTQIHRLAVNKLKQSRISKWMHILHYYSMKIPPSFCFDQPFLPRVWIWARDRLFCFYRGAGTQFPKNVPVLRSDQLRPKSSTGHKLINGYLDCLHGLYAHSQNYTFIYTLYAHTLHWHPHTKPSHIHYIRTHTQTYWQHKHTHFYLHLLLLLCALFYSYYYLLWCLVT